MSFKIISPHSRPIQHHRTIKTIRCYLMMHHCHLFSWIFGQCKWLARIDSLKSVTENKDLGEGVVSNLQILWRGIIVKVIRFYSERDRTP